MLIIPIYSSYDGFIPEFDDWVLGEVIEDLMDDPEDAFDYYRVSLTTFALLASALLLLFAFCKLKIMIILTCIGGIISMGYKLIDYIDGYSIEHVLDFESGNVGIGFWIPFIIFITCLSLAVRIPSESNNTSIDTQIELNTNNEMEGK